ncbi:MAG: hypothetical protein M9921_13120 [Fimbriimonadaceae bacterium]|nr:hypothetical protein [Fimbriimonadaceae bacterium]
MRNRRVLAFVFACAPFGFVLFGLVPEGIGQVPGDQPVLREHVNQSDIDRGRLSLAQLFAKGKFLFEARFNRLDGFGRPAATGNGVPTKRTLGSAPLMNRVSGPDSNSCFGCHNLPESGGGGDFVANVFVLGQLADPVLETIDPLFSNERNTLGMHGSGAIETLAVEMTQELHALRASAAREAAAQGHDVVRGLIAKGVDFGEIRAHADGSFDTSGVEGVDPDLIIKPFHQKGVVNSLRVFTVNAYNHHHGMEAVERFGTAQTGEADFDEDGVPNELSVGDITAATIYQAALSVPRQVLPHDPAAVRTIRRGEQAFSQVGCGDCHRPTLVLDRPVFHEPNPYNPPGNLRPGDVPRAFEFDLTFRQERSLLERLPNGKAAVHAFTDLKRHKIADAEDPFFANERVVQGGVPLDVFLTRKLWDCGSSSPFGHRGDCTTVGEAIQHHAGEARAVRERFFALPNRDQAAVIQFLQSLQVVPGPP